MVRPATAANPGAFPRLTVPPHMSNQCHQWSPRNSHMAVYKRGRVWWYRFTWKGDPIRESTKQTNRRVAEQIEAAHKTSLAKGEVGIRDRKPASTIRQFAKADFLPFCRSTFAAKLKTLAYYEKG